MKKIILLLIPFILIGRGYNHGDLCRDVKIVVKEAKMINEKFDDPKNAFALLKATVFRKIIYRKPKCMSEKEYLSYLDTYAYFSSKTGERGIMERFIKKYPDHLYFYKTAGETYEQQFYKYKNDEKRQQALKYYIKYIELSKEKNQKVDEKIIDYVKSGGLEKAKYTWGKYLNPKENIPSGKFRAFYIDTHNPKKVIATEVVPDIAISYIYDKFHGIDSSSFGGYWVGEFEFAQDTKKMIYISHSQSTTRIIIDGYIIFDNNHKNGVAYNFTKGKHTIEVEYINRWHTTHLSVKIMDKINKLKKDEIIKRLKNLTTDDTNFNYVGVYESKDNNNSIHLKLEKSPKPIVLLLQSYKAVIWDIDNSNGVKIEAIVINSSKPEAEIRGDIDGVEILYSQRQVGNGYKSGLPKDDKRGCKCISGHYTCSESRSFMANEIPSKLGKKISGFSGKYATKYLTVPEIFMTPEIYEQIEQSNAKIREMEKSCTKNRTLTPDELFE